MFGTLRPHRCTLSEGDHDRYRSFYCGLCHTLGAHHGTLSRATLSRDAVFVALLADGLAPDAVATQQRRCPLTPFRAREVASPGGAPMRMAAHVQILLADQWLADREADGQLTARVVRPLAAPAAERARAGALELGLAADRLRGFEERQLAAETPGISDPRQAAEPTAQALAVVLGSLGGDGPSGAGATLRRLGRAVGRVIYLNDALEDLRKDTLRGEFNPCLSRSRRHGRLMPSATRVRAARRLLDRELAVLPRLLGRLPLRRNRTILRNILCDQLRGRALRAGRAAVQWTSRGGQDQLIEWRARPRLLRAAVVLLTVTLSAWGWAREAGAAVLRSATTAVGGGARGRGSAEPLEFRPLERHTDSLCQRLGDRIVEFIQDCCDVGSDFCDAARDGCTGCCGVCDECERLCDGCSDACGDCTDSCDSCCQGCDSCCDGCDDCGNCCNDCDGCCNDCG